MFQGKAVWEFLLADKFTLCQNYEQFLFFHEHTISCYLITLTVKKLNIPQLTTDTKIQTPKKELRVVIFLIVSPVTDWRPVH